MKKQIETIVKRRLKKEKHEEMISYFEDKYEDLKTEGYSDEKILKIIKTDINEINVKSNAIISTIFFPILTVIYILLNSYFSSTFTWIIFPIGVNIYLYIINIEIKYILVLDAIILLIIGILSSTVILFGWENLIYAFLFLYITSVIILFMLDKKKYLLWPTATIIYIVLSMITNLWSVTWIIFVLAAVYGQLRNY